MSLLFQAYLGSEFSTDSISIMTFWRQEVHPVMHCGWPPPSPGMTLSRQSPDPVLPGSSSRET